MSDEDTIIEDENDFTPYLEVYETQRQEILKQMAEEEAADPNKYVAGDREERLKNQYKKFLIFKELGAGAFGSVQDYYNVFTRENYAKKYFADVREYQIEKNIMTKLDTIFSKEKIKDLICTMQQYDVNTRQIFYESGTCNLNEVVQLKIKYKIFWWEDMEELIYTIHTLIDLVKQLADKDVFHTDIKTANVVYYRSHMHDYKIKLIDMGSACFDHEGLVAYTPRYFPTQEMMAEFNITANKENRLRSEIYTVGRTVQEIMLSSIYAENKQKYGRDYKGFLDNIMLNDPESIKKSFEVLRTRYDDKLCNVVEKMMDLQTPTKDTFNGVKSLGNKLKFIYDRKRLITQVIQRKLSGYFAKNDPIQAEWLDIKKSDREWWMPSKIQGFIDKQRVEREKKSLDDFVLSIMDELEFFREFEMFGRGLEKIDSFNLPEGGLEHVVLCYYKCYYAVEEKKLDVYIPLINQIDKKHIDKYKKQSVYYTNMIKVCIKLARQISFASGYDEDNLALSVKKSYQNSSDPWIRNWFAYWYGRMKGNLESHEEAQADLKEILNDSELTDKQRDQYESLLCWNAHYLTEASFFQRNDRLLFSSINNEDKILNKHQISEYNYIRGDYYGSFVKYHYRGYTQGSIRRDAPIDQLIQYGRKSLEIMSRVNQSANQQGAECKLWLGCILRERGDYDEAAKYIGEALQDFQGCELNEDFVYFREAKEYLLDTYDRKGGEAYVRQKFDEDWVQYAIKLKENRQFKLAMDISVLAQCLAVHGKKDYLNPLESPIFEQQDVIDYFKVIQEFKRLNNYERALHWCKEMQNDMRNNQSKYSDWDRKYLAIKFKKYEARLNQQKKDPIFNKWNHKMQEDRKINFELKKGKILPSKQVQHLLTPIKGHAGTVFDDMHLQGHRDGTACCSIF